MSDDPTPHTGLSPSRVRQELDATDRLTLLGERVGKLEDKCRARDLEHVQELAAVREELELLRARAAAVEGRATAVEGAVAKIGPRVDALELAVERIEAAVEKQVEAQRLMRLDIHQLTLRMAGMSGLTVVGGAIASFVMHKLGWQ